MIIKCIFDLVGVSYNQPVLPSYTQWNPKGITVSNEEIFHFTPWRLFVDRDNTVYVNDLWTGGVYIWYVNGTSTTITLDNFFTPESLFVTIEGNIYVSDEDTHEVQKWSQNPKKRTVVMNMETSCFGLFVDNDNYLYCSLRDEHQVVKRSLNVNTDVSIMVAGTGIEGSAPNMLNQPRGIFVDTNFDLYVADCGNSRIQLFKFGQRDGITVAGADSTLSITLFSPIAVFLDTDGYLFIVDQGLFHIIGSNLNGFYCVIGCPNSNSDTFNQFIMPIAAAFDSYGNIFIVDNNDQQIQKFVLMTNISSK